jgi:hypothetical protein
MPKDRIVATFVLTAVLAAPVVLYKTAAPFRNAPEARPVRPALRPEAPHPKDPAPVKPAPVPVEPAPAPALAVEPPADVLSRDPMMSPHDYFLKEEAEIEAQRPRLPHHTPHPPGPRGPRVQDRIELQAIITVGGRPTAIVNGIAVSAGQRVEKVKVLRISDEFVLFDYRGKTFRKTIGP